MSVTLRTVLRGNDVIKFTFYSTKTASDTANKNNFKNLEPFWGFLQTTYITKYLIFAFDSFFVTSLFSYRDLVVLLKGSVKLLIVFVLFFLVLLAVRPECTFVLKKKNEKFAS